MSETTKAKLLHDVVRLERMDTAMRETAPRMRRSQLVFLWDKYVIHAAARTLEEVAGDG